MKYDFCLFDTEMNVHVGNKITIKFYLGAKYSDFTNIFALLGRPKSCKYIVDNQEVTPLEWYISFNKFFNLGE